MENEPHLAQRVHETITRHKVSRNEISKQAGIPYATLTRKLQGHSDFTVKELGKIAKVLGLTVGDLIPAEILDAAA